MNNLSHTYDQISFAFRNEKDIIARFYYVNEQLFRGERFTVRCVEILDAKKKVYPAQKIMPPFYAKHRVELFLD